MWVYCSSGVRLLGCRLGPQPTGPGHWSDPDMLVVGTGANGQEALRLCEHTAVDVLVMDVRMPVMDGIEATRLLVERVGTPNILILTTFNTDQLVLDAVAAGARGFLLKDAEPDIVLSGIRVLQIGRASCRERV